MAIKTSGAELKRFYSDEVFWPENSDVYHDDETIFVDGRLLGPDDDIFEIPDSAKVTIDGGIVFGVSDQDGAMPLKSKAGDQLRPPSPKPLAG